MSKNPLFTRVPEDIVARIRADKISGLTLTAITRKYGIGRATASVYCRDFFQAPNRKYATELQAREANREHGRERRRSPKEPRKAGKKQCPLCRTLIRVESKMCIVCCRRTRKEAREARRKKKMGSIESKRSQVTPGLDRVPAPMRKGGQTAFRLPRMRLIECPSNPGKGHYWVIDPHNHGVCKGCGASKQFTGGSSGEEIMWREPR